MGAVLRDCARKGQERAGIDLENSKLSDHGGLKRHNGNDKTKTLMLSHQGFGFWYRFVREN
jgi:hypothetical protein